MFRIMLRSKIHWATVTEIKLNYEGSITIDEELIKEVGFLPGERVEVFNVNNGARFATYVIPGKAGSGTICLNGAAARLAEVGDKLIIVSYVLATEEEARNMKPKIVRLDEKNRIQGR